MTYNLDQYWLALWLRLSLPMAGLKAIRLRTAHGRETRELTPRSMDAIEIERGPEFHIQRDVCEAAHTSVLLHLVIGA